MKLVTVNWIDKQYDKSATYLLNVGTGASVTQEGTEFTWMVLAPTQRPWATFRQQLRLVCFHCTWEVDLYEETQCWYFQIK